MQTVSHFTVCINRSSLSRSNLFQFHFYMRLQGFIPLHISILLVYSLLLNILTDTFDYTNKLLIWINLGNPANPNFMCHSRKGKIPSRLESFNSGRRLCRSLTTRRQYCIRLYCGHYRYGIAQDFECFHFSQWMQCCKSNYSPSFCIYSHPAAFPDPRSWAWCGLVQRVCENEIESFVSPHSTSASISILFTPMVIIITVFQASPPPSTNPIIKSQ
jgi:hypothetical protein